ncbi:CD209 antigen-like protein C isoform X2 [Brachyhypopomus gauderio]|uniref:CD209 antigen-like protein C isoform X2 n=1 Tax=Brachyhypopomus gauderio TaxID=698409 RepID=UPI0040418627
MSQIYDNVIYTVERESKRGEQVEMAVDIYESTDAVRDHDISTKLEDTDSDQKLQTQPSEGDTTERRKPRRRLQMTAVCLGLLCVHLLTVITVLWVKFTAERDHLQTRYNNLTIERERVQRNRDRIQLRLSEIDKATEQGWMCFSSSFYYISTELKNWNESRQDCRERGADLVIINSREEQNFVSMMRRDKQVWIGLTNTNQGWKWVDGTALMTKYWNTGEPNGPNEHCVITGHGSDSVQNWADYQCIRSFFWICEKSIFR